MRLIKNSLRAKSTAHCVSCRIESKEQKGRFYTSNRRNDIFPTWWCLQSDLFSYFQPLENCFPPLFFLYGTTKHQWCCWHTRGILPFVFPVILYEVSQWNYITVVASLQFHISLIRTYVQYVPTNWRFPVSTGTLGGTCASSSTYETIYVESFPTTGHFFPRTRSHYPLNDCFPNFFVQSPSLRHRTPPPSLLKVPPYSLMTLPSSL